MVITDIQFLVTGFRFEEPMKVAFATITDMDSCIVKVLTDEGITGYGEAAPLPFVTGDNLGTVLAVGKDLRNALLGMDPRAIGTVHRVMDRLYAGNVAVKAGIDIACYDIAAKAAGVPLYKYLGGEDVRTDLERMCAINEAVSGKARLRIDANQGWTVKDTLWISRELASLGVELIEQPVAAGDFEGLREIRMHSPILIAADESCHGIRDAMRLAAALDIIREVAMEMAPGIRPAMFEIEN